MGDNKKPAGWGQNKNMPDSWGKGSSSSPWGQKQDKPAGWGGNNSSPELGEKKSVPPVTPSKQETIVTEHPEAPVYQETVETDSTISLIKEETPVQADETVISDENDYETPEPFETALPDDSQDVEVEEPELDFAESEPEPEIMPPPVAPPPAPQNPRPVQQQAPQRPPYRPPEPSQSRYQQPYRNNSERSFLDSDSMDQVSSDYMQYPNAQITKSETGGLNVIKLLIIAVILTIALLAILVTVLDIKDSINIGRRNARSVVTDAATTSAITTIAEDNSTSISTILTSENTTATTTQTTSSTTTQAKMDTSEAVKRGIISCIKNYSVGDDVKTYNYFLQNTKYALYDLDNNGIDELFISYPCFDGGYATSVYLYKNGEYVTDRSMMYVTINLEEHILRNDISGGGHGTEIFTIINGELMQKESFSRQPSGLDFSYTHNNRVITESEYKVLCNEYDNKNWIDVPDVSTSIANIVNVDSYLKYDPEMDYNDTSNLIAIGKVTTESSSLNMRKNPSTSADVVTQIPKDVYLGIVSSAGDWYYVKYYATTSSPIYYGYVHGDYITITEWLQSQNNSLEKYNGTSNFNNSTQNKDDSSFTLEPIVGTWRFSYSYWPDDNTYNYDTYDEDYRLTFTSDGQLIIYEEG